MKINKVNLFPRALRIAKEVSAVKIIKLMVFSMTGMRNSSSGQILRNKADNILYMVLYVSLMNEII